MFDARHFVVNSRGEEEFVFNRFAHATRKEQLIQRVDAEHLFDQVFSVGRRATRCHRSTIQQSFVILTASCVSLSQPSVRSFIESSKKIDFVFLCDSMFLNSIGRSVDQSTFVHPIDRVDSQLNRPTTSLKQIRQRSNSSHLFAESYRHERWRHSFVFISTLKNRRLTKTNDFHLTAFVCRASTENRNEKIHQQPNIVSSLVALLFGRTRIFVDKTIRRPVHFLSHQKRVAGRLSVQRRSLLRRRTSLLSADESLWDERNLFVHRSTETNSMSRFDRSNCFTRSTDLRLVSRWKSVSRSVDLLRLVIGSIRLLSNR